jgi:hypothetical protein
VYDSTATDVYRQLPVEKQALKRELVHELASSPALPADQRAAAQLIDENYDWLLSLDKSPSGMVTQHDLQILVKSLDPTASANPYNDLSERVRYGGLGGAGAFVPGFIGGLTGAYVFGVASIESIPVALGFMVGSVVVIPTVLTVIGAYAAKSYYDSTKGGSTNFYALKRNEAEQNGIVDALMRVHFKSS